MLFSQALRPQCPAGLRRRVPIKRNGVYDEIYKALRNAGKTVFKFSGIMSNPTYAKVLEGAKLVRENCIDLILAKAVSVAAVYKRGLWADFQARSGVVDFELVPLGIVVTVSGTGSKYNGGVVITNQELKIKTGRDYPRCNARFALMDPVYTFSVPVFQMVSGGFDTLSHIMEIYFSAPDEENGSNDIAEALMRGVIRDLWAAVTNREDYAARSNMMWEVAMAENRIFKLGKQTDFQRHMMEHQLGAYTNCNHGAGLAVLHPAYYHVI